MQATVHQQSQQHPVPVEELVFQYLRRVGFLTDLKRTNQPIENIGKITCRDDRTFMRESNFSQKLHSAAVLPYPIYGGAMRCSPYCPEMPDNKLGFKCSPNANHVQILVEAIRSGIAVRNNRLLKAGGHGPYCGWAAALGLGAWQTIRLIMDGARELQERSSRESWVKHGQFEIFPAYHVTLKRGRRRTDRTYAINKHHELVIQYPMGTVMSMSDHDFLRLHAPELLGRTS